jgi:gliding motility-associated-like protein
MHFRGTVKQRVFQFLFLACIQAVQISSCCCFAQPGFPYFTVTINGQQASTSPDYFSTCVKSEITIKGNSNGQTANEWDYYVVTYDSLTHQTSDSLVFNTQDFTFTAQTAGYFYIQMVINGSSANGFATGLYFRTNFCPTEITSLSGSDNTCQNTCISYRQSSTNYPTTYEWRFEGGQPPLWSDSLPPPVCYPDTGIFTTTLIVSNPAGADTAIKTIHVAGGPSPVPVEHSFLINEGDSVTLSACAKGSSYSWAYEPSIITNLDTLATAQPDEGKAYRLTVVQGGCEAICNYTVYVKNGLLVPTAFSPNNDGVNDVFRILNTNIKLLNLAIYNRWGEQVFYSTDILDGWDGIYKGIPQPMGTFVWACDYEILKTGKRKTAKGNVTLLR